MKRVILITALIFATTTTFISCRETTTENRTETIREVEVERSEPAPEATEERKGILERTGERVDSEVNEGIDREIDRIGDDN